MLLGRAGRLAVRRQRGWPHATLSDSKVVNPKRVRSTFRDLTNRRHKLDQDSGWRDVPAWLHKYVDMQRWSLLDV
jgi:hypothetical protein